MALQGDENMILEWSSDGEHPFEFTVGSLHGTVWSAD